MADETFIVVEGELRIDFRDGAVRVSKGEMFVVPKGVQRGFEVTRGGPRRGVRSRSC